MESSEEIEKADYSFRSYGLFTLIILPLLWSTILLGSGPAFLPMMIISSLFFYLIEKKMESTGFLGKISRSIGGLFYFLFRLTFGLKVTKKNIKQIRYFWFFSLGAPITLVVAIFSAFSFILIIPALFVLFRRQQTLLLFFRIAFLPRGQYFGEFLGGVPSEAKIEKEQLERQKLENIYQYSNQYEYYQYYPPNRVSRISAYVLLIFIPIVISLFGILIFDTFFQDQLQSEIDVNEDTQATPLQASLGFGLVVMIPYLFLSFIGHNRYSRFITTSAAEALVKGLAYSSESSIPMISGDYFVEQNSRSMDMHHNFGFFEIFRDGRILTMILLPLSIYSYIFGQIIEDTPNDDLDAVGFFSTYQSAMSQPIMVIFLLFVVPFAISALLPLTWVLADAEIKRATWTNDEGPVDTREISGVEDLGKTINRFFSLFIGVSAITGLTNIIDNLLDETNNDTFEVYKILLIIVLSGFLIVFPGTMFMTYRYFSRGDHANGVNYLRYKLSRDPNIGVGTIQGHYQRSLNLPEPISPHIRRVLKLDEQKTGELMSESTNEVSENPNETDNLHGTD